MYVVLSMSVIYVCVCDVCLCVRYAMLCVYVSYVGGSMVCVCMRGVYVRMYVMNVYFVMCGIVCMYVGSVRM